MSSAEIKALLAGPALEAPEGVTPDFTNPDNRNGLAWFVTTFCMVIATICLLLRLYARMWKAKKVTVVEVMAIGAYGAYWGTAYAAYALIYTPGYYVHQWNLHMADLVRPLYLILVYGCCYSAVLPLLKGAILLDWCSLFVVHAKTESLFWWGCMGVFSLQVVWGIACVILLNMQCVPHAAIWEFYLPSKCYNLPSVMLTSASVQVFSDICMVLLPQKIVWGLNMNWQKKLGVSIIFGVGLLASIAACVRLYTTVIFAHETDTMYFIGPLLFWACAEMTCGFFILSVPCLPNLVKHSSIPSRVKSVLGFSRGTKSSRAGSDSYQLSKHGQKSKMGMTPESYFQLEESRGVTVSSIVASESQERLRREDEERQNAAASMKAYGVTRTTEISVVTGTVNVKSKSNECSKAHGW